MANPRTRRVVAGTVLGAVVGLLLGAAVYLLLTPVLEASDGMLRELQGLVWNLVPLGTVAGALIGWALARRGGT